MPIRRTPFRGAAQGGQEAGTVAGAMSMPPTPGLGGPSGTPQQSPMSSPMGMSQPQIPGMGQVPGMAGMPDVHAGGPSSPFNIDEMLKTNEPKMQPNAMALPPPPPAVPPSPIRRTLQPWGDSAGTPKAQAGYGGQADNGESQPGQGQPQPGAPAQAPGMGDVGGGMAPMVMLRLLKSLGRI